MHAASVLLHGLLFLSVSATSEPAALGRDMSFVRARPQGPAAGVALSTAAARYGVRCGRVALPQDISQPKAAGSEVAETNKI